jgi:2-methylisocitrate lyase-like PEP mutase family enzyme
MVSTACALGAPDVGLITMSEHLRFCASLADATGLPVVADCDAGYGPPATIARTVQAFDRAGVAAVVIEDQVTDKQASLYKGDRSLVAVESMVDRIKAAVDARFDTRLMIWARTDALSAGQDHRAAQERASRYTEAGADVIVPTGRSLDELFAFAAHWRARVPLCLIPTFFPALTLAEIRARGFSAAVFALAPYLAAMGAVRAAMESLLGTGSMQAALGAQLPFDDLRRIVGHDDYLNRFGDGTTARPSPNRPSGASQ